MSSTNAAIYLAGHGSQVHPRLIELQHRRILRYRELLRHAIPALTLGPRDVFIDLSLPKFAMGQVYLQDVPGFSRLLESVKAKVYGFVLVDLDDMPRQVHEVRFVREVLEEAGATVLNAFTDDMRVFEIVLKDKFGTLAREEDVTDGSDFVCFYPTLAHEIIASALRNEILKSFGVQSDISERLRVLKALRPYNGGSTPFIEDRLSQLWQSK